MVWIETGTDVNDATLRGNLSKAEKALKQSSAALRAYGNDYAGCVGKVPEEIFASP
jgi:hypothetical protein